MFPALLTVAAACSTEIFPPAYGIGTNSFSIPVTLKIDAATVRATEIWMSRDYGLSWSCVGKVSPEELSFAVQTAMGGDYWFGVHVVFKNGRVAPPYEDRPDSIIRVRVGTPVVGYWKKPSRSTWGAASGAIPYGR